MTVSHHKYANNLLIDRSKCTFCGNCAERCIMDNIRIQLSPCRQACPIGQNCQAYIQQIARGQTDRALATILETSPLPGTLSRICSHPCETVCTRNKVDGQSVAIRSLKRYVVDNSERPKQQTSKPSNNFSVGIVGSGPAGLMASWYLARLGYSITIYEKEEIIGGNLSVIIPDYRLPQNIVTKDISWIGDLRVIVRTGVCIGKDISLMHLQKDHDALLLAAGACKPIKVGVPGEDAPNVYSARSFLKSAKQAKSEKLGKAVLVVGGGNTAIDSALTAKRLGAEEVRIVCLERTDEMTAFPKAISEAIEEGIIIDPGWGPSSFRIENGLAVELRFNRCVQLTENECFAPLLDDKTEHSLRSDVFIIAIGDRPDYGCFESFTNTEFEKSAFPADPITGETKISNIFVAGDFVGGATSVVEAMGSGRKAAVSIDRYLQGENLHYGRQYSGPFLQEFEFDLSTVDPISRQDMPKISISDRQNFQEINLGYGEERAQTESKRCLSCGVPVGYHDACWYCLPCEVSCPETALKVDVPYTIR